MKTESADCCAELEGDQVIWGQEGEVNRKLQRLIKDKLIIQTDSSHFQVISITMLLMYESVQFWFAKTLSQGKK